MAGLYIHIPFCASRCIYCGFYSTTSLKLRQQYVDAVCREMILRSERSEVRGQRVDTVYLGGGTPSQLTTDQLHQLFLYINKVYQLPSSLGEAEGGSEITIEMNPDDVTAEYAAVLSQLGINRVSMGAQTFDDERLRFLHRRHTASQVRQAVDILRKAGIRNISIDLMYGFPNETLDNWQRDIDAAQALGVEHISAYCLMIEENTPLWKWINENGEWRMDEELERQMYEMLIDKLTEAGYEHYEISNFAKPGYRSRHNSSYWQDIPYIGLGAAAHSYTVLEGSPSERAAVRSWNVADIQQYIKAIERGELPSEKEVSPANLRRTEPHYPLRPPSPLLSEGGTAFSGRWSAATARQSSDPDSQRTVCQRLHHEYTHHGVVTHHLSSCEYRWQYRL